MNPSEENEGYDAVHVENMKCENEKSNQVELDLYDPGKWKNINSNLRDLIVEKGPIRDTISNKDFPKDENSSNQDLIDEKGPLIFVIIFLDLFHFGFYFYF